MIQVKKSIECSVDWKIPIREAALLFLPPWAERGAYLAVRGLLGAGCGAGPSSETPGGGWSGRGLAGQAGRVLGLGRGPADPGPGRSELGGPGVASSCEAAPRTGASPTRRWLVCFPAGWRGPCPGLRLEELVLRAGGVVVPVCSRSPAPLPGPEVSFPSALLRAGLGQVSEAWNSGVCLLTCGSPPVCR